MNMYDKEEKEIEEMMLSVVHFNIYYNTTKAYQPVVDSISSLGGSKEVWCIVTNTARAIKQRARGLSIPKTKKYYLNNKQGITYRKMFALLDKMVEEGLLIFHRGGILSFKTEEKVQSVYMFTEKYLSMWGCVDVSKEDNGVLQEVIVRDRETGDVLSNRGRKGVAEKGRSVKMLNDMLCATQLHVDNSPVAVQQYMRVFNNSLEQGGRFYNTVGGVQTLSQTRRKEMTINGEEVVELDFKAIHPSLLYEKARQKDPVLVDSWIEKMWKNEYNPYPNYSPYFSPNDAEDFHTVRAIHKFAVMVGLNASSSGVAGRALCDEYFSDVRKKKAGEVHKYGDISYINGINGTPTFPAKKICEFVQDWNRPIANFFFSDVGIVLQGVDSDIMAIVIEELYEMGEVLLPVHDSVVVRKSIADTAERLMRKAYKDVMDTDVFCHISRK